MTFIDHFSVDDDAIAPQPWMQLRNVGTVSTPAVAKSYDVDDGNAKNEVVQNITAAWTNNSPVTQLVYGMVTRGGSQVTLQVRTRAYLKTFHGVQVTTGELCPDPDFELGSAFVPKGNAANGYTTAQAYTGAHSWQLVSNGTGDTAVLELLGHDVTAPTLSNGKIVNGQPVVAGEQYYAEVEVRPKSTNNVTPGHLTLGVIFRASNPKAPKADLLVSMTTFVAPTATTWVLHSGTAVVPKGYDTMFVGVQLNGDNPVSDTYYFDQAHVRRVTGIEAAALLEVGKFGNGANMGVGGLLATGATYGEAEVRSHASTYPLLPQQTGMWTVKPGETISAQVQVTFVSDFWENTSITEGDSESQSFFISGETRMDLFAVPSITPPPSAAIPTIVGGAGNVTHDIQLDAIVSGTYAAPALPTGLQAGDVLLAVVCNQFGLLSDISPYEDGWTLAHRRNEGLQGAFDVHMCVYTRMVTDPTLEPSHYRFHNPALPAEMIAALIPLRGTTPYSPDGGSNWFIASNLSTNLFANKQVAPSVTQGGQLLICTSYFNHSPTQFGITQTPPDGLTEVLDVSGVASALSIAVLSSPPNPTGERHFVPSQVPIFFGHSIAASIVVPGLQNFS